jgi:predicted hydrocarbon binding protein
MKTDLPKIEAYSGEVVSAFGYELLRTVLLPELLGEETAAILYWSGRKLARHYPFNTVDEIVSFFEKATWGNLVFKEESRGKAQFMLHSDFVEARIKDNHQAVFSLEAGFLAEQLHHIKGYVTESFAEVKSGRDKKVMINVQWDMKDPVDKVSY